MLIPLSEARFGMGAGWPLLCFMSGEELHHCASPVDSSTPAALRIPGCSLCNLSGTKGSDVWLIWWRHGAGWAVAEWEWAVEKITECPQCLPKCLSLTGSAAGAHGRKGTSVVEPREETVFS